MPNMYEMLIGAGPSGPEQTKQAAQMLRKNQGMNELAMLSGDRLLNPMGQQQAQQTQQRVGQLQQQRQFGLTQTLQRERDAAALEQQKLKDAEDLRRYTERMEAQDRRMNLQDQKFAEAQQKDLDTRRAKLSGEMTKAQIPEIKSGIGRVDEILAKYQEGDIPGVGPLGRWSQGDQAREMKQAKQTIENILLKARSGAAVTQQEYDRFLKEFGGSWAASDQDFLTAWADFKNRVGAQETGIYAGYTPDVIAAYGGPVGGGPVGEGIDPATGRTIGEIYDGYEYLGGVGPDAYRKVD